MGVSDYVVAIDLGSSKIVGCLGKKEADGRVRLLAMEQKPFKTEVRRGIVYNIEEISKSIMDLVQVLSDNKEHPCKIDQVYVGLNGYTIRTLDVSSTTYLSGDELVNERHLDELSDDAQSQLPENLDVMDVFTQEFLVDGQADINPVGSMPKRVEGHYKIVGGKSAIMRNLEACFNLTHTSFECILGPLASAEAILRPEDKSKGVVAIDFGAQTTSICIYKGNLVRYVSVLPFGGDNVTKDLLQLNIDEIEAEKLKLNKGTAIHFTQNIDDQPENEFAKMSEFDKEAIDITVARMEETVENIWAQIRYSGIDPQKLTEGLVLTGGASQMDGLSELLIKKTGMNVRFGKPNQYIIPENLDKYSNPTLALSMGLLLLGQEGGCSVPEPIEVKKPEVPKEQSIDFNVVVDEPVVKPVKPVKPPKPPRNNPFKTFMKSLLDDEDL